MDTTEDIPRNLDQTKSSMNVVDLNNMIVSMRSRVKKAKQQVSQRLVKQIKLYKNKKGTEEQAGANKKKSERLFDELQVLKKCNVDKISKFSLGNTESIDQASTKLVLRVPTGPGHFAYRPRWIFSTQTFTTDGITPVVCSPHHHVDVQGSLLEKVYVRVACHRPLHDFVTTWRQQHDDWKSLAAFIQSKNSGRRYKKRKKGVKPLSENTAHSTDAGRDEVEDNGAKSFDAGVPGNSESSILANSDDVTDAHRKTESTERNVVASDVADDGTLSSRKAAASSDQKTAFRSQNFSSTDQKVVVCENATPASMKFLNADNVLKAAKNDASATKKPTNVKRTTSAATKKSAGNKSASHGNKAMCMDATTDCSGGRETLHNSVDGRAFNDDSSVFREGGDDEEETPADSPETIPSYGGVVNMQRVIFDDCSDEVILLVLPEKTEIPVSSDREPHGTDHDDFFLDDGVSDMDSENEATDFDADTSAAKRQAESRKQRVELINPNRTRPYQNHAQRSYSNTKSRTRTAGIEASVAPSRNNRAPSCGHKKAHYANKARTPPSDSRQYRVLPPSDAPPSSSGPLHPSWEASKKRKLEQQSLFAFQGKKTTFDD